MKTAMQTMNLLPSRQTCSAIVALLASVATMAHGQGIPALINYQGRLTDTLGAPVASGYYELQFRIWDDATQDGAGNLVWARSFPLHVVTNGLFNVLLSDAGGTVTTPTQPTATLLEAFNGPDRYLGLTITLSNGVSVASQEISPRQQLASAPFAVHAQTASATLINSVGPDSLQNGSVATAKIADSAVTTAKLADGAVTSDKVADNVALLDRSSQSFTGENNFSGKVGIGTSGSQARLDVRSAEPQLFLGVPNGAQGQKAVMGFWATFENSSDNVQRRTADLMAGFEQGTWGAEYLSLNVGNNGNSNDGGNKTSEKVRIRADGHVGIGTSSPASTLHVNGSMTVGNGPVSMFRPMQAKSVGTKYTAETDGFVVYWGYRKNMKFNLWLAGQSTALIDENVFFSAASSDANSFTWPIAKGESWQFSQTADFGGSSSLWWRPIGLGN